MSTVTLPSPLLNEKQAAELLGISPGTMAVWRCRRSVNLPHRKIGHAVRYAIEDLLAFSERGKVNPAGDPQ
jgi:hypothetical protein